MREENIPPVDLAQSAIGPGIAVFSRYAKVLDNEGNAISVRDALYAINEILSEVLSGEDAEMDAESRFALTWFEQFGFSKGSFGDAETLAKAKNTSVQAVEDSGVVMSAEGVRLLTHGQLSVDWDPITDTRLTVWEVTHYLIRNLLVAEDLAVRTLRSVGFGMGERAKKLCYQLFSLAEKRAMADAAADYNMLIAAWPEIERLARLEPTVEAPVQQQF